jgi:hypothetical protein
MYIVRNLESGCSILWATLDQLSVLEPFLHCGIQAPNRASQIYSDSRNSDSAEKRLVGRLRMHSALRLDLLHNGGTGLRSKTIVSASEKSVTSPVSREFGAGSAYFLAGTLGAYGDLCNDHFVDEESTDLRGRRPNDGNFRKEKTYDKKKRLQLMSSLLIYWNSKRIDFLFFQFLAD